MISFQEWRNQKLREKLATETMLSTGDIAGVPGGGAAAAPSLSSQEYFGAHRFRPGLRDKFVKKKKMLGKA